MQVSRDLPKQNVARLEFEGRYLQFGMRGWSVGWWGTGMNERMDIIFWLLDWVVADWW